MRPGYVPPCPDTTIYLVGREMSTTTVAVWHLRDLRDGGGLGFMVGLFFLCPHPAVIHANEGIPLRATHRHVSGRYF